MYLEHSDRSALVGGGALVMHDAHHSLELLVCLEQPARALGALMIVIIWSVPGGALVSVLVVRGALGAPGALGVV